MTLEPHSTLVVLCNATPGQEDAFLSWMINEHASEMLTIDGIERVIAYRSFDRDRARIDFEFIVHYEIAGRPAELVLADIDELVVSGRMTLHHSFDAQTRVRCVYETVLDVDR
jgi:hypothetical protein